MTPQISCTLSGGVAESGVENVREVADMLAIEEDVALGSTPRGIL